MAPRMEKLPRHRPCFRYMNILYRLQTEGTTPQLLRDMQGLTEKNFRLRLTRIFGVCSWRRNTGRKTQAQVWKQGLSGKEKSQEKNDERMFKFYSGCQE